MGISLALVGCGAMGSALLKGWLTLSKSKSHFKTIWVIAPHQEKVSPFLHDPRVRWLSSPEDLPKSPDIIVFAVKPFLLEEILPLYKSFPSLFVSVAAGKPLSFYEKRLSPLSPIIRAMPNTPVSIHKGVIGLLANVLLNKDQIDLAKACFKDLGFCLWVTSDDEIDKITALAASGPAYVFYMIEALAHAAESLGFQKETALYLSLSTFLGTSTYAQLSGESPTTLREKVTSPKGTTAAALKVLEREDLYSLIERAVKAAYGRAKELRE